MDYTYLFLAILSAILAGIGVAMERKGLSRLPEITPGKIARNPVKVVLTLVLCRIWIAGWIIAQIGWALSLQAFNLGDYNVVKALSSLGIVVATVLSVLLLGEKLGTVEKAGILLVTVGTLSVSLESQLTKTGVVDYNALVIFNFIALVLAFSLMITNRTRGSGSSALAWEAASATAAGIFYSVSSLFQYLAEYGPQGSLRPFNMLSLDSWLTYLLSVPFVIAYAVLLLGFFSFQSSMSRGRASIAYPISTSLGIAIPILGSALIFGELLVVPVGSIIQFPLSYLRLIGTVMVILGGALIQTHSWKIFRKNQGNANNANKKETEEKFRSMNAH